MRVKAVKDKYEDCPLEIVAFGSPQSKTHITIDKCYEVFALSVFRGVVFFQIVNDVDIITWKAAWFFEVINQEMPTDWICFFQEDALQLVIGPEFVARDEAAYNRMVELELESVEAFYRRLEARKYLENQNDHNGREIG